MWFVFHRDDIVITAAGRIPCGGVSPVALPAAHVVHTVPLPDGTEIHCVALDCPLPAGAMSPDGEPLQMMGLRASFNVLTEREYNLAGKAREILHWDATTRFCGTCGTPTVKSTPISKRCPQCGREMWPALAVAIIVLIRRTAADGVEEALLVQAHTFRGRHYGLVAGFVETGESLEECLEREIQEEVGFTVRDVRYFGSQPWPFPSGLMVGYTAEYAEGTLSLQQEELSDARWFRPDNLPTIPGKASLARRLIDAWLATQGLQ